MIARRTVLGLGLSQLILWGITYYLIGGFGDAMTADLGASRDAVYGGFSAALGVMALASPMVLQLRFRGRTARDQAYTSLHGQDHLDQRPRDAG